MLLPWVSSIVMGGWVFLVDSNRSVACISMTVRKNIKKTLIDLLILIELSLIELEVFL